MALLAQSFYTHTASTVHAYTATTILTYTASPILTGLVVITRKRGWRPEREKKIKWAHEAFAITSCLLLLLLHEGLM